MGSTFILNKDHKEWARRAHRNHKRKCKCGRSIKDWEDLIRKNEGRCALTEAPLLFHTKNGISQKDGKGCHPLYASIDHIKPGCEDLGLQIVCYDINDLKAHLPFPLFESLKKTRAWKEFRIKWKKIAEKSPMKRAKFKELIKQGE